MRSKGLLYVNGYIIFILFLCCYSCHPNTNSSPEKVISGDNWKAVLRQELPLLGHRNWILIVDKAFPALNAPGIRVIYANENLLGVLRYTFNNIDSSSHVRSIIYTDKEIQYITPQLEKGIDAYRDSIKVIKHNVCKTGERKYRNGAH